jgi:uncharacterized protein DUF5676
MIGPIRTGIAFSLTVGAAHSACAFIFWLWPNASGAFTSALFHGLDFRKLHGAPKGYDFAGFAYALAALMVWAFVFGALFDWIRARIGRSG